MNYIKIVLVVMCILFESCNTDDYPMFPKEIRRLEAKSIKLSRGFIIANDSIFISGNFHKNLPFNNENCLEGHLHVGDIVLNPTEDDDYIDVIKKNSIDTIRYFVPVKVNGKWQLWSDGK